MKMTTPCSEAVLLEAFEKHKIEKQDFDMMVQSYYGGMQPTPIAFPFPDLLRITQSADCSTQCVLFEVAEEQDQTLDTTLSQISDYFDTALQQYVVPKVPGTIRCIYSIALLQYMVQHFPGIDLQFFKAGSMGSHSLVFSAINPADPSTSGYFNYSNEGPI